MDFDDFEKKQHEERAADSEKKNESSAPSENRGVPKKEEDPWFARFQPESIRRMEEGKSPDGRSRWERVRDLFFDVDGRLDRRTFAARIVIAMVLCAATDEIAQRLVENWMQPWLWAALVILIPFAAGSFFSATVRRLHDINRRGEWSILVLALPMIGLLGIFYLAWKEGTKGRNQYGKASGQPSPCQGR